MQFPHESFATFSEHVTAVDCKIYDQLLEMGKSSLLVNIGETAIAGAKGANLWQEGATRQFEIFNGHRHGAELVCKEEFPGLIKSIGYRAPKTVLLSAELSDDENVSRVMELDQASPMRFLKPLAGSRSQGTRIATSPEEAVQIASHSRRPYLVQSYESPQEEWRYALHRDPQQVQDGSSPQWRVALRKRQYMLTGNGYSTIPELAQISGLPRNVVKNVRSHQARLAQSIPAKDKTIPILTGSVLGSTLPSAAQLEKLDDYFTKLICKLEQKIGAPLVTSCFDFGLTDSSKLHDKHNTEPLTADDVVLYEFQVPFGGYNHVLARKVFPHNKSFARKVSRTFLRSMFVGGKVAACMINN